MGPYSIQYTIIFIINERSYISLYLNWFVIFCVHVPVVHVYIYMYMKIHIYYSLVWCAYFNNSFNNILCTSLHHHISYATLEFSSLLDNYSQLYYIHTEYQQQYILYIFQIYIIMYLGLRLGCLYLIFCS